MPGKACRSIGLSLETILLQPACGPDLTWGHLPLWLHLEPIHCLDEASWSFLPASAISLGLQVMPHWGETYLSVLLCHLG